MNINFDNVSRQLFILSNWNIHILIYVLVDKMLRPNTGTYSVDWTFSENWARSMSGAIWYWVEACPFLDTGWSFWHQCLGLLKLTILTGIIPISLPVLSTEPINYHTCKISCRLSLSKAVLARSTGNNNSTIDNYGRSKAVMKFSVDSHFTLYRLRRQHR